MTPYKFLFAAQLLCLSIEAEVLRGRVLDSSHSPIHMARLQAGQATAQSDIRGEFAIEIPPGTLFLAASKDGFRSSQIRMDKASSPVEIILAVAPLRGAITVTEDSVYLSPGTSSATRTFSGLSDIPQSVSVVTKRQVDDQLMMSVADAVRYLPGVTSIQGENNRDQLVIRGNSTSADFFLDGIRDDVQRYRDLYNLERLELLEGPNALIFGRGGGGGVVNRVTKEAGWTPLHEIRVEGGSFGGRRFAADFNQPINDKVAMRLNEVYENSDSFRRFVNLERYGIAPTIAMKMTDRTQIALSYELFQDFRTADRGVPSFLGRPLDTAASSYFGNPDLSKVRFTGHLGSVAAEHHSGRFELKNRTLIADYDRFYQNFVPGPVTADRLFDSLSAYNNATHRRNLFNRTDLVAAANTGRIGHTLLAGAELGRQLTDNFRSTGYFGDISPTLPVPLINPVTAAPVTFRQSSTDANNHLQANVAATYVQDQVHINRYVQLIAGLRFDYFDLEYHDYRTGTRLRRIDHLVSPRAGIVVKPIPSVSLYATHSLSYLPSSGDQFSSLTTITQQVKPERFDNREVGVKWSLNSELILTAALFRLDRTNTRSTDPNDPGRIVQTGSQRTNGAELGWTGTVTRKWTVAGGFGYQNAFFTNATIAARAGAQAAQTPHLVFSLWNRYQFLPRVGAGLGVLNRGDMFAAVDNSVVLNGYSRADAAIFFTLTERIRCQANVENLFNGKYFLNADSNNNLSPGSPRTVRVGLIARF